MQPRRDGDRLPAEQLRIGTVEREAVVERLQAALGEGRLDVHEFDDRVAQVYTARTAGGLLPLTADLPVSHSAPRPAPSPQPAPRLVPPPARPDRDRSWRALVWAWRAWAMAVSVNLIVWVLVALPTGDPPYFWPMGVAGPWGAVLLVGTLFRSAQLAGSRPRAAVLVLSAGLWYARDQRSWVGTHGREGALMRRQSFLVVVAAALAVLGITPAAGADGDSSARGEVLAETSNVTISRVGAWVYYRYSAALGGSQQRTYVGRGDGNGGCTFSGQQTVSPSDGAGVTEEREVASSTEDCIMVTEIGRQPTQRENPIGLRTELETAVVGRDALADAPAAQATTRSARHKTYYEDPPGIDVNSAETHVTWTYSGGCVTSSRDHYTVYGWYSPSGWRKDSSSTTSYRYCGYARTTSNSYFFNGAFCFGIDTRTQYTPNEIKGEENGTYTMRWSASKSGGCTDLLSFHRSYSYT